MDPLVDAFQRINPTDHSLDGLPVTVFITAVIVFVLSTLTLRFTGRSWRRWSTPALCVLYAWWAGVNVGHSGFGRGGGLLWTVLFLVLLLDAAPRAFRAALMPAKRDGWG